MQVVGCCYFYILIILHGIIMKITSHLIHLQNVSDNTDHHEWMNKWHFQGPENFIFQKIHSHNKLKYGHIDTTKGSAYILVYILLLVQYVLCLHLFLFILNIKKSYNYYNLNLLLLKMSYIITGEILKIC